MSIWILIIHFLISRNSNMSNNNIKIDSTSKIAVSKGTEDVTISFVDGKLVVQGSKHLVLSCPISQGGFEKLALIYPDD